MKTRSFQSDKGISTGIIEPSHCQRNALVGGMGNTLEPPRRTGGDSVRVPIHSLSLCDSMLLSQSRRLLGSPDPNTLLLVLILIVNCIHKSNPRLYVCFASKSDM